jgi:hypothetical protein
MVPSQRPPWRHQPTSASHRECFFSGAMPRYARLFPQRGNVGCWHMTSFVAVQQNPTLSRALRTCRRPGGGLNARAASLNHNIEDEVAR